MKQDYLTPFLKKANLHILPLMSNKGQNSFHENKTIDSVTPFGSLKSMNYYSGKELNDLPLMEDMPVSGGGIVTSTARAVGSLIAAPVSIPLNIVKGTGDYIGKKMYRSVVSKENVLALMITDAITEALKKSDKYVKENNIRYMKIKRDINKIKRLSMPNAINLYYGGGLLVFGPSFKIEKMIHMFYDTKTKPQYFSTSIDNIMPDNVVNTNLTKYTSYDSDNIVEEIKKVINP
jgi:hypothetical protein